jgi:arylsulfatase A-like enzyme
MPLLTGNTDEWSRDAVYYHYYEYPGFHMVKRHYGIVTKEYKLAHFYYDIDEWELYDREADPLELNNVYNDPEYADVINELKIKLEVIRKKYKDSKELDQKYIRMYEELGISNPVN